MRNNKLVLPLLVLLLLVGAGVGVWFVMQNSGGNTSPGIAQIDDEDVVEDDISSSIALNPDQDDRGDQTRRGEPVPDNGAPPDARPGADAGNANDADGAEFDPGETRPGEEPEWTPVHTQFDIEGVVRFKSDGRPAVGADITVKRAEGSPFPWPGVPSVDPAPVTNGPSPNISGRTTTDNAGKFIISVTVTAYRPKDAGAPSKSGDKSAPPSRGEVPVQVVGTMTGYAPAQSRAISPSNEKRRVELQLAVPTVLRGHVVDATNRKGVADARISLYDVENMSGGVNSRSFNTDENGYFVINNLPASIYGISIEAEGYSGWSGWEHVGRLILKGGEERDLGDIALLKAVNATGLVLDAETGEPVAGATVEFEDVGAMSFSSAAQTDNDGRFTVRNLSPGVYEVNTSAPGYARSTLESLSIETGQPADIGVIKLGRGIAITGTVTDADGEPVPNAVVGISEPREGFMMTGYESTRQTTSESDGSYKLRGLNVGKFRLTCKMEGFAPYSADVKIERDGQRVDIALQTGATVTGRVVDATGAPVKGAEVVIVSHKSQAYSFIKMQGFRGASAFSAEPGAVTDGDGRFELKNVADGDYLVACSKGDHKAHKDNVTATNDESVDIGDLRFRGNGSARIIVTKDGVGVPDMKVSLMEGRGFTGLGSTLDATTDSTGTALIEDVPAGTYSIIAGREDSSFDTDVDRHTITIKEGKVVEYQLELRPTDGVRLHGRLTLNGEAMLTSLTLVGKGALSDVIKMKELEEGYYEFLGLKPGQYTLYARVDDTTVACRVDLNLTTKGDHPFNRDFKGFRVAGSVSTPDGTATQFASTQLVLKPVTATPSSFERWLVGRMQANADGVFEFSDVPPGDYRLTATIPGVGSNSRDLKVVSGDVTGIRLDVVNDSGSVKITISTLNGTPVSGGGFGSITLTDTEGNTHEFADQQDGFMMINENANATVSTVAPGVWAVEVAGSGYLPEVVENVRVTKGKVAAVEVELTAAAALYLTTTNTEITQAMLDKATVRYFDSSGSEVEKSSNIFDAWTGSGEASESPTLVASYIAMDVSEVRVKLDGYAELIVMVDPSPGLKIEKQGSFTQ